MTINLFRKVPPNLPLPGQQPGTRLNDSQKELQKIIKNLKLNFLVTLDNLSPPKPKYPSKFKSTVIFLSVSAFFEENFDSGIRQCQITDADNYFIKSYSDFVAPMAKDDKYFQSIKSMLEEIIDKKDNFKSINIKADDAIILTPPEMKSFINSLINSRIFSHLSFETLLSDLKRVAEFENPK